MKHLRKTVLLPLTIMNDIQRLSERDTQPIPALIRKRNLEALLMWCLVLTVFVLIFGTGCALFFVLRP